MRKCYQLDHLFISGQHFQLILGARRKGDGVYSDHMVIAVALNLNKAMLKRKKSKMGKKEKSKN